MSKDKDIVTDIFHRVRGILGVQFSGEINVKLQQEELKIRREWGGGVQYIRKDPDPSESREKAITLVRQGTPIKVVVKSTGISRSQLYLLLKSKKRIESGQ